MPEGAEIETEKLHEAIKDELEHEGGAFLRSIALSTTILAAIAAVAALQAGGTVNEALARKSDATRLQAEASDQWSYFQAKGVKAAVAEAAENAWLAAGKPAPPAYAEKRARYDEDQKEIKHKAEELEKERDVQTKESEALLHRHHGFANAVALFQVAIALGALAALTRIKLVWLASMGLGVLGVVFLVMHLGH